MAANINVDWSVLEEKGKEIAQEAVNLRSSVDSIQKQVVGLQNSWQSNASDNMLEKMNAMTSTFERFEKVVNEYASFLGETSRVYAETENNVAREADNKLQFK